MGLGSGFFLRFIREGVGLGSLGIFVLGGIVGFLYGELGVGYL